MRRGWGGAACGVGWQLRVGGGGSKRKKGKGELTLKIGRNPTGKKSTHKGVSYCLKYLTQKCASPKS